MNILIADDYELVRYFLKSIIAEGFPSAVIRKADGGLQLEKLAKTGSWDIIIADMFMPDKSGLEVLKQLRSESINIPVLIISIYPENQYALEVLRAGGNGCISKGCPKEEFIKAVKMILNGKKYISAAVAEILSSTFDKDNTKEQHELISDRELEVLKVIASGKTVSEIAKALSLSISTVSTYRHRILEKMNMKNNAELTHYAINHHLV